jgi:hypothetical protein
VTSDRWSAKTVFEVCSTSAALPTSQSTCPVNKMLHCASRWTYKRMLSVGFDLIRERKKACMS